LPLLENGTTQTAEFAAIHRSLRLDASTQAAEAVLALISGQSCS
jgi:lipid-A-disaccharide synthase